MQRVGPSPYANAATPARIMSDGGAVRMTTNGPRHFKRRRVDGTFDDADPVENHHPGECATSGEAYVLPHSQHIRQWNSDAHPSRSYPTSNAASAAAPAVAADPKPAAAATATTTGSASALTEPSAWQASNYPDLASYQQQPYFYSTPDSTAYNPSWPPPSEQSYGASAASTTFPGDERSNAPANMPFFPVSQPAVVAGTGNSNVDSAASAYSNGYAHVNADGQFEFNAIGHHSSSSGLVPKQSPSAFYFDDASMHLKIQSLPILDNLATQLIHTISKASFPQIQELMRNSDSEDSQAYRTLKSLFDQTRKVYSRETPFIDAIAIQMFQPNQQEIIRKANIATFVSSILGAHDVSFFHLNEYFMETFVPLGHRLLKWQGAVFLELKTQIYISALMNSDGSRDDMLDELFPSDLDAQILTRHPDAPSLSPSEQDFIDRSRQRKSYLIAEPSSRDAMKELPKKYQWSDFVREFASCISKNVDGIVNVPVRLQGASNGAGSGKSGSGGQGIGDLPTLIIGGTAIGASGTAIESIPSLNPGGKPTTSRETPSGDPSNTPRKPAPTASTIRQPWTRPEEDALLAGLERVSGPHWSQILALYGRGGSVSEVLKDRNQVQLKDKARNLKLHYLKTGKEVPASLQGVTGELRKRGGARARAALGLTDADDGAAQGGASAAGAPRTENIDPLLDGQRGSKKKAGKR